MSNKMLIDATHPEETRVVVVRDKRVEDFDFEAASRKPLRGNIYLAKVTRVEPSLQAAFVDFGGNRHGFLPFSEIHPDYYQIPHADRQALLDDERAAAEEAEAEPQPTKSRRRRSKAQRQSGGDNETAAASAGEKSDAEPDDDADEQAASAHGVEEAGDETGPASGAGSGSGGGGDGDGDDDTPSGRDGTASEEDEAAERRARTEAASTHTAENADVVASDLAANAEERQAEAAAASSDDEPSALGRAAAQVAETVDADVEAADMAPRDDRTDAPEPTPAETVEGAAHEPADATSEAADPGAPGSGDENAGNETGDGAPRRRRRARKTAEGLADPQVSEAEDRRDGEDGGGDDGDEENGGDNADDNGGDDSGSITSLGSSDALEEIPERRRGNPRRNYKIQEVIKRRQIILVQVVKEERGTKGAALTTYLSLAGRYSVLMPNTDRGGGVSRKITDAADRKRLKSIVSELDVPEGMGIILRTAGAARTKTEIKRDFEYLLRLWENVRELTLKSIAPQLVYEEGNLVKRSIRDLYSKEIDEVLVAGEAAYREAKDFMRMLMPSHAKNVKPYREPTPIFTAFQVEAQLDAMFSPQVTLPSKGYIVINPTEALVAIDVNSGKSTKESSIEETALKTNLEAADEVARQLRLRDLAGLIVIDFIDMDEKRHNRQVEKRLKEALKLDRSRIQVGRISPFGLMEMSRQRIRQGMVETSMIACPACSGTGQVRSTPSVALHCLRTLEEHVLKDADHHVTLKTSSSVALYILNQKRAHLNELEQRFGLEIGVDADETLGGQLMQIVKGAQVERAPGEAAPTTQISPDAVGYEDDEEEDEAGIAAEAEETEEREDGDQASGERGSRRKRRRRRRGGGADEARENGAEATADNGSVEASSEAEERETNGEDGETAEERRSRRRRGRRGGRRHRREERADTAESASEEASPSSEEAPGAVVYVPIDEPSRSEAGEETPVAASATGETATTAESAPEADVHEPAPVSTEEPHVAGQDHRAKGTEHTPVEEARSDAAMTSADASPAPADEQAVNGAREQAGEAERADAKPAGGEQPTDASASTHALEEAAPAESEDASPQPEAAHHAEEPRREERRPRRVGWWQRRSLF